MSKTLLGILIVVGTTFSIARQLILDPQPPKSIAVLPLIDLGSVNDQGYFVDGVREEITNRLDRAGLGITVTDPGSRFHDKNTSVLDIARSLRVDAVLQGTVRRTGGSVHASFSLFDTSKKSVAWTKTYELRSDSKFALEDELAKSVVPSVTEHLLQ